MAIRGIEISGMIKIFIAIRHMMPEGPREQFERIARGYAERNDADRGSVPKAIRGRIEFYDEDLRSQFSHKLREERFNDKQFRLHLNPND